MKDRLKTLAHLATPVEGGKVAKIILAGGSAVVLVAAGAVALVSFFVLLAALGAIYLIATRILGIDIEFDPRAFYEKYASRV